MRKVAAEVAASTSLIAHQNLEPIWLPHWPPWMWTISLHDLKEKVRPRPAKTDAAALEGAWY